MRPSRLLSKHLTDASNIQHSNSVNCFNLCATIWMVRIFEGTPAIPNFGKKVTNKLWSFFATLGHPVCILRVKPKI
jgi:hypothetical protein